jgi:hypothetical protein
VITVASTTESPEQIKADLQNDRFHFAVTDETADVTGQPATPSTPETPKPAETTTQASPEGEAGEAGQTAAELETAPQTHEPEAVTASDAGNDKKDRAHKKLLKQIDKATKRFRTEESRAQQLAEENERLRQQLAERDKPATATPPATAAPADAPQAETAPATTALQEPVRPRQGDFADWNDYERALDKYDAELKTYLLEKATSEFRQGLQDIEARRQQAAANEFWGGVANKGRERYSDWDAVTPKPGTPEDVQYRPEVAQVIASSPLAHDLLYHLARNPIDAQYIASLEPAHAARELGRLEALLEGIPETAPAAPAAAAPARTAAPQPIARVTPASVRPAPITPVNTAGSALPPADTGRMTPREYRRWRESQRTQ